MNIIKTTKDLVSNISNAIIEIKKNYNNYSYTYPTEEDWLKAKIREYSNNSDIVKILKNCLDTKNKISKNYEFVINKSINELTKSLNLFRNYLALIDDDYPNNEIVSDIQIDRQIIENAITNPTINIDHIMRDYNDRNMSITYYYEKIRPNLFNNFFNLIQMHCPESSMLFPNNSLIIELSKYNNIKKFRIFKYANIFFSINIFNQNKMSIDVEYNTDIKLNNIEIVDRFFMVNNIIPISDCSIRPIFINDGKDVNTLQIEKLPPDLQYTLKNKYRWYQNFNLLKDAKIINIDNYNNPIYPDNYLI